MLADPACVTSAAGMVDRTGAKTCSDDWSWGDKKIEVAWRRFDWPDEAGEDDRRQHEHGGHHVVAVAFDPGAPRRAWFRHAHHAMSLSKGDGGRRVCPHFVILM
jgi:hypothetical protein